MHTYYHYTIPRYLRSFYFHFGIFAQGADAAHAGVYAAAFEKGFLQIGLEAAVACHINVAAQKLAVVAHPFSPVADFTNLCHRILG